MPPWRVALQPRRKPLPPGVRSAASGVPHWPTVHTPVWHWRALEQAEPSGSVAVHAPPWEQNAEAPHSTSLVQPLEQTWAVVHVPARH